MRVRLGILWLALALSWAIAKKSAPEIEETSFKELPVNLFYFDGSNVVLVTDTLDSTLYRSEDAGVTWKAVQDMPKGEVFQVFPNQHDNQVAVALSTGKSHWITKDQGKTWKEFKTGAPPSGRPLSFHASDPDRILFVGEECSGFDCTERTYYTTDGFKTIDLLLDNTVSCMWAKSTDLFTTGDKKQDLNQVVCVVEGKYSPWSKDYRLLISDDYFERALVEPELADGRTVPGVISIAAVKGYIVAAAKSEGTTELAMYVTDDTITWHRAEFGGHKLEEDAYTILESTNYSIQVDVMTTKPTNPMGVLFTSNSNGTYFTKNIEHTNRNFQGYVDFEKIQNIQGIVMVNTVANWEKVESDWMATKMVQTRISFDDGRTWQPMRAGKKNLHLHSVTEQRNSGRISSSPAPGIVLGVGNTGDYLKEYQEGDLYVSDDAGLTWTKALDGPHLYEFGDQGAILVAVEDNPDTREIKWSINHGKDWDSFKVKDKIRALELTTVPDSTSLKFILKAAKGGGSKTEWSIYSIDFDGLHASKCKTSDFEKWNARVDEDGEPTCIMGHKQSFRRRKANADCFVDEEFKDPIPNFEDCKCTDADYECDYNFIKSEDGKQCVPAGALQAPEGECKSPEDTFKGSSGYRLIPGNTCIKKGGKTKDDPVERPCKATTKPIASGKIASEITSFHASAFKEYYYLERANLAEGDDETIIMRTDRRETYITHDHGKSWAEAVPDDEIVAIYPHQYFNHIVYLVTGSKKVYYSQNRGKSIHSFDAPEAPNQDRLQILGFHPKEKDWLLWTGGKDCSGFGADCHSVAHVSTKGGDEWKTLLRFVRKCQFITREGRKDSEQLIYCEQFENEDPERPLQLLSSSDWFEHKTTHFNNVINFATMSEFIVVAIKDEDQKSLRVDTSIDGSTFANAKFPKNFQVPHQQAYTVLESSTHAIFLHVTVNGRAEQEYGSIVKSNSNGTSYVLSISDVNRNTPGYVDFEKMQGLEGVAVVNIVANVGEADSGSGKKLKTMITHNDGAEWGFIAPPEKDTDGKPYGCDDHALEKCSLHLHGYTERKDPRDTFSSPSAVGLMMGVGNVGEYLGRYKEGNTFVTRDGGVTWHEVFKGTYMWEYGDQGSIIVIVEEGTPVQVVFYSLDEGATWTEYQFSDTKLIIDDISTVPSDTSRNFLLWGKGSGSKGDIVTVNIDFSGLTDKKCNLNKEHPEADDSDYYLWEPKHPLQDSNCLFGHVAQYYRKKTDRQCYNDHIPEQLHDIAKDCSCTRQDFECDYNYQRANDGSCQLVEGLSPADPTEVCKNKPDVFEYYDPTGYRRIPLTTCHGGKEMDYTSQSHPCPGREDEYQRKKGIGGWGVFFAITIPIAAATGAGYWVWRNWDGKFGRIRLGDGTMGGGFFDSDRLWIKYPVAAVSGLIAVVAALPMVIGSIWRAVSSRLGRSRGSYGSSGRPYTSRSSFQRGRGEYAVVDPDEGELLGDESDEEV
ncbi:vacuolar protein sorting/targeting protein PEP1 [Elasticomyces elasticus]|nr:vacuolar protein sorting/targeting protein PEP1 [Elasticomyces elasticus]